MLIAELIDKSDQIMINGLVVDAREAPRETPEEAVRRGLIPYLPENTANES
jgi:hypothetical protein